MRIRQDDVQKIISAISNFVNSSVELRLFGSRVDDTLKGGDIDLLLVTETSTIKERLLSEQHVILAAIKKLIGDQKIDLKIVQQSELSEDSFLKLILPKSILLKQW